VILQFLILFQYISGFSQTEKENTRALLAARGANKQTLVQPTYTVTEEQVQWINDMEARLINLLRTTKPHGNLYTDVVLTVLKHERNWVRALKGLTCGLMLNICLFVVIDHLEVIRLSSIRKTALGSLHLGAITTTTDEGFEGKILHSLPTTEEFY
jgi:hypothetical protein